MKKILFASNSFDMSGLLPVATHIRARGHHVVKYESDRMFSGEIGLTLKLKGERHQWQIDYGEESLTSESIHAAWYRRPSQLAGGPPSRIQQLRSLLTTHAEVDTTEVIKAINEGQIRDEIVQLQKGLFSTFPARIWLNSPMDLYNAENKLLQLRLAAQLGFDIPSTVISNKWEDIVDTLQPPIIVKMPMGHLYEGKDSLKIMYSRKLAGHDLNNAQ